MNKLFRSIFGTRECFLEVIVGATGMILLWNSLGKYLFTRTVSDDFFGNIILGPFLIIIALYKKNR